MLNATTKLQSPFQGSQIFQKEILQELFSLYVFINFNVQLRKVHVDKMSFVAIQFFLFFYEEIKKIFYFSIKV